MAMHKAGINGAEMAALALLAECREPPEVTVGQLLRLARKSLVTHDASGRPTLSPKGGEILSQLQSV